MSLSVASSAASFASPVAYGLAGLPGSTAPRSDAPQRPSAAPSWTWTPDAAGSGRGTATLAQLIAVLSQRSVSDPGDRAGAVSTAAVVEAGASPGQLERTQDQDVSQATPLNDATQDDAPSQGAASADSAAAADVKLDALFRTLQAYGL